MQGLGLFVIGHSPAIIMETLAARSKSQMLPKKIAVITTETGASILTHRLFDEGGWAKFCAAWPEMASIEFSPSSILKPDGVDDIRSELENKAMTNLIFNTVKSGIEQSDFLDASLAGGRKTMGYYLGLAMNLFARKQDRLTHVLVPEDWERDSNFLFPVKGQAKQVTLIDVPFIRLKDHVKATINRMDLNTLVASAQTSVDMSVLEPIFIHIKRRMIRYLGKEFILPEREFSIYLFFAQQKVKACKHPQQQLCEECKDCFLSVEGMEEKKDDLMQIRATFGGRHTGHYERFEKAWDEPRAAQGCLPEPIRRIAEEVEHVFAVDPRAEKLLIKNVGKRNAASYGLLADKTQIRIERN